MVLGPGEWVSAAWVAAHAGKIHPGPNSIRQSNGAFQEPWERSSRGILLKFGDSFLDLVRLLFGGIQI
jgi:hypothetical protein